MIGRTLRIAPMTIPSIPRLLDFDLLDFCSAHRERERERIFSRIIFVKSFLRGAKCLRIKRNKEIELYAVHESMYVNGVREISERYEAMTKIHFSRGKLVFRPFLATSLTSTPRPYTHTACA